MSAKPADDVSRTLIDLPVPVKARVHRLAQRCASTVRIEIIAAMIAWADSPDPDLRAKVAQEYDRRARRGYGRERGTRT